MIIEKEATEVIICQKRKDALGVIDINEKAIDKVAEKISQKADIPVEKAKAILGFGVADAIMLNRFRRIFKDSDEF